VRIFGGSSKFRIPQSADEPMAALDLLYWSIFACLKSHVKDLDPSVGLEMGMFIANSKLEIYVPASCKDVIIPACKECYILKHLKLGWAVTVDDKRFGELKEKTL
jgi:hypothetical protein